MSGANGGPDMSEIVANWPRKTRELQNHHMDSTLWDDFPFRDDDVVVGTYAKAGTTWTQQIVGQLIHQGDAEVAIGEIRPGGTCASCRRRSARRCDAQPHRRVVKTHLPADALVMSPKAKYLYVARDGRDVIWSLHNHHSNQSELAFELLNETPGTGGPAAADGRSRHPPLFHDLAGERRRPYWSFWENIASWWALRGLPNVKLRPLRAAEGRPGRRDARASRTSWRSRSQRRNGRRSWSTAPSTT